MIPKSAKVSFKCVLSNNELYQTVYVFNEAEFGEKVRKRTAKA